ncbi:MAG: dTDP-4-dehydrorhamnose reductase [Phycisphaerales bacterium]|nr:MAG: dTDP-4-dehydrorhamnose reductase [Phycisphaerales bacterium]
MKILLTGSDGQIGWELCRTLPCLGEVTATTRSQMDLADRDAIGTTIRTLKPNLIVNAAGYTAVDRAEEEPAIAEQINGWAPGVLAEEARNIGAAIVHYSTDYVFDGARRIPYAPHDEPNPLNVYGRTKLAGERAIIASGADHLILRTSWVYSLRHSNFLLTMLRLASDQPVIRVVDDQHGCPTWSRLIARATTEIIAESLTEEGGHWSFEGRGGVYHLASGGETTWCALARRIFASGVTECIPEVVPIATDQYGAAAARPPYSVLDCRLTERTFGITLDDWKISLAQALQEDLPLAIGANVRDGR